MNGRLGWTAALIMTAACSDRTDLPIPITSPQPLTLRVSPSAPTGVAGAPLDSLITVRAENGTTPAPAIIVSFAVSAGGRLSAERDTTDASGVATVRWTLGATVGAQTLTVAVVGGTAAATVTATARAAQDLTVPTIDRAVFATGLTNPWDLAFLPDGSLLVSERFGAISRRTASGQVTVVTRPTDVVASGEGGMLGITLDPAFATNRFLYACFSSRAGGANDNRVVRWRMPTDTTVADRTDIVTGMPWANGGRHSGCRPRFGPDGFLWIGTGDAAVGSTPQDLRSLGGKVLRVTRDGTPAPGNPALANADPRIFTFGHRNVQGVAFQPGTNATFTAEHGPGRDDEVNRLQPGMNAGWDPVPGYNESVAMTDRVKYPNAVPAVWSTGAPARGMSGATFLRGANWRAWHGALALGQLSGLRLVVLTFDAAGSVATTTNLFEALGARIRTPVLGPDSALYVTTDAGGGQGQIWRLTPR